MGPLSRRESNDCPSSKLHHDVELPLGLADLVQLTDMGMTDRSGCASFAPESLASGHIEDHLDGHLTVETLIVGGVDDPHPALSDLAGNTVVVDPLTLAGHHPILVDWYGHHSGAVSAQGRS